MREILIAVAVGVLACAVWFLIETALRGVKAKLQTKKERRSRPKDRRSKPYEGE